MPLACSSGCLHRGLQPLHILEIWPTVPYLCPIFSATYNWEVNVRLKPWLLQIALGWWLPRCTFVHATTCLSCC